MVSRTWTAGLIMTAAMVLPAINALPEASASTKQKAQATLSDDSVFMALRDASRNNDAPRALELATRLVDYPIPSYVDYFQLRPRLAHAPVSEIRAYLKRYQGHAIADRLRNDWLLELGKVRDWALFDEEYPQFVLDDDMQLKCYALMSKVAKGINVAAEARALLTTPRLYGDACPALIAMLVQAEQFTHDDLWSQVRLAAETGAPNLFAHATALAGVPADLADQAFQKPESVVEKGPGIDALSRELFVVALGRMARNSPELAAEALINAGAQLPKALQAAAWAQIALPTSLKLVPVALDYWKRAEGANLSQDGHQWRTRMALREGDWAMVKASIDVMPLELRNDATWVYWRGRALKAQGQNEEAKKHFQRIAHRPDFYGQLALEELGQKIKLPAQAALVTAAEVKPMAGNEGFQRALKFFEMGLRFEGVREWNWELRSMNERELLAAAEFAREKGVLDRMINTSDRTRQELNFTQRFPTPFKKVVQSAAETAGIEEAWVYGLMRQESRFVMDARSHVGASGLMQLMPATARYVARKIGVRNFKPNQVNKLDINIKLGTHYLSMVLSDLDGSLPLATAAYNAGPRRPHQWRATLTRPVEGAIFAETIPFTETRGYVKSVLSNAVYYAALNENKGQSLKARLGVIQPKAPVLSTELP